MSSTVALPPMESAMPELWMTLLKSFGMLCIVIGVLIAVLWLLRRAYLHSGRGGRPGVIQILSSLHVSPKEKIVLVDVLGEKLLLGITSQQISLLTKISDEAGGFASRAPEAPFKALFRRKLSVNKHSDRENTDAASSE
jgi:flagellar protein FliO/FliZ